MNNYIVETNQLSKDFSGEVAVNQLSIHIRKNEIYGFWDQMVLVRVLL